jgi:hypothetical protein
MKTQMSLLLVLSWISVAVVHAAIKLTLMRERGRSYER